MLKEELHYDDKFPVSIRIVSIENYPLHYHPDVEFIFVLHGQIRLRLGSNDYLLKEGSVFVCNGNEVHSMICSDHGNTVALIQVSNAAFSKYYPNLSRSCYRTYTENPEDERLKLLRKELANLLSNDALKPHHYQQNNVAIVKKLLNYLEANFNYFYVKDKIVMNKPLDNFALTQRISRIILSVYENHYRKLSISELSKRENLSTFYLSHCIQKSIGLSFRELLSFARVESSQALVLDETVDLKDIYGMVGFSATQYFNSHFLYWFGMAPDEYRMTFLNAVKSASNREVVTEINHKDLMNFLSRYERHGLRTIQGQSDPGHARLNVNIHLLSSKAIDFAPEIAIATTYADRADTELMNRMEKIKPDNRLTTKIRQSKAHYGLDAIAGAVFLLKNIGNNGISLNLKDPHSESLLFQGYPSLIFCNGVPKCSYYALLFLSKARGKLIDRGMNYWVIRKDSGNGALSFIIIVFNGNEATDYICTHPSSLEKTSEAIAAFNEELNIRFTLNGLTGPYKVGTISIDSGTDYFYYLNNYGKRTTTKDVEQLMEEQYTSPYVNIYNADAMGFLEVNARLDGLCVQFISISPLDMQSK